MKLVCVETASVRPSRHCWTLKAQVVNEVSFKILPRVSAARHSKVLGVPACQDAVKDLVCWQSFGKESRHFCREAYTAIH